MFVVGSIFNLFIKSHQFLGEEQSFPSEEDASNNNNICVLLS